MEVVLIILVLIAIILYANKFINNDIILIQSEIDEKYYLVRNLSDKQTAANLLSEIKQKIISLVTYLNDKKNDIQSYACNSNNPTICKNFRHYIDLLNNRIKNTEISEGVGSDKYTSYSVNKGEQIVLCLRSLQTDELHDINLIMYVVIHELSHIACPEYGHTELFKQIFVFLLKISIKIDIYKRIDFLKKPEKYCGLLLTDSIF